MSASPDSTMVVYITPVLNALTALPRESKARILVAVAILFGIEGEIPALLKAGRDLLTVVVAEPEPVVDGAVEAEVP